MKLTSLSLLLCLVGCINAPEPMSELIAVTAKQLLDSLQRYADKIVRVSGYWVRGFEWSNFSANADDITSDIWLDALFLRPDSSLSAELQKKYIAAGMEWPHMHLRVWIDLEGRFEHHPFKLDETRTPFGTGFGHLSRYQSQIRIIKYYEIRPMPDLEYASPR